MPYAGPCRRLAAICCLTLACLTVGATAASGQPRRVCATPYKTTVAYTSIPGVPANATSLDVYAPVPTCRVAGRPVPVVLWVHGGGYQIGDKANQVADKVRLFASRGWAFVSVNYRLTVTGDPASAHYPAHYRDVAAAVAWTRSHISAFGGNPHRLALLGHSAGADIVSNVADNPVWLGERGLALSAVRCAGPFDTAGFDKTRLPAGDPEQAQWREALGNDPAYAQNTSATLLARAGTGIARTITVVRGTPLRRSIEAGYASRLAALGIAATTIDASSLTHDQVNQRIGAPGDMVMTPPLMRFLTACFHGA